MKEQRIWTGARDVKGKKIYGGDMTISPDGRIYIWKNWERTPHDYQSSQRKI